MNDRGFTLIELIVTIALLAVISIISFVSITGAINQNKISESEGLIKNIKTGAKEWASDNRYNVEIVDDIEKMGGRQINAEEIDGNVERFVSISANRLLNLNYLSSEIVSPFNNSEIIDGGKIIIRIYLKDDYTVKNVNVYMDISEDDNNKKTIEYTCDDEKKLKEKLNNGLDEKDKIKKISFEHEYSCNEEWWNFS